MHSSMAATGVAAAVPWYRTVTREQWRVLLAAKFGWMLDAMDFMLYTMAVGQLRSYFGFGDDTAGMLGTATLVMSGVGGAIFGYVADRFGRTRALMASVPKLQGNHDRLQAIPGNVPRIGNFPPGCRFAPRCTIARRECSIANPELVEVEPQRWVRCPFWK